MVSPAKVLEEAMWDVVAVALVVVFPAEVFPQHYSEVVEEVAENLVVGAVPERVVVVSAMSFERSKQVFEEAVRVWAHF